MKMKMRKKHIYVEKVDSDFTSIRILEDPYKNVIFTFGKVSVKEPEVEGENAKLSFDFVVNEIPPILKMSKDDLENEEDFKQFIGDILVGILEDSVADEERSRNNS